MIFSSSTFLFFFFPIFFLVYFASGRKNWAILVFSLLFYAWGGLAAVPILLFYIVFNYYAGLAIGAAPRRAWLLAGGVAVDLAVLVFYKYSGFLERQVDVLFGWLHLGSVAARDQVLPLGISFFTFQGISYLIDVARGDAQPQRSLLNFAMYKAMFPQLIAGPIVRYRQIASRIERRQVSVFRLRHGVMLFAGGLAQKCLIANMVAWPADAIFKLPDGQLTAATAWLGTACYAVQILFDFGGYSAMAIGMGHMMGFSYPPNFDRPYAAQSVTEFWRRWHMSLSSWFRDYLYLPLGGNRHGAWRTYRNLFCVFLLCGFWHGASWTFAVWGLYHGAFLVLERVGFGQILRGFWRPVRHLYLLLAICGGWVLFRADSLHQAGHFYVVMAGFGAGVPELAPVARFLTPSVITALAVATAICALPPLSERRLQLALRRFLPFHAARRPVADGAVAIAFNLGGLFLAGLAACSLAANTYNPFIYFRF